LLQHAIHTEKITILLQHALAERPDSTIELIYQRLLFATNNNNNPTTTPATKVSTTTTNTVTTILVGPTGNNGTSLPQHQDSQQRTRAPFQVATPLLNSVDFFGREADRNWIWQRITGSGSLSLVGERRIGKTWLLKYIELTAPQELGSRFRVVYLDLMAATCETQAGFCEMALAGLGFTDYSSTGSTSQKTFPATTAGLERAIRYLSNQGYTVLILLDEIDRIGRLRSSYTIEFFVKKLVKNFSGLSLNAL
jgi:hypothetical protein